MRLARAAQFPLIFERGTKRGPNALKTLGRADKNAATVRVRGKVISGKNTTPRAWQDRKGTTFRSNFLNSAKLRRYGLRRRGRFRISGG